MKFIRKYFGFNYSEREFILWIVNDSINVFGRKNRFSKDSWEYWTFFKIYQFGSIIADGYTSLEVQFTIRGKQITFAFTHFIDNATFRLYHPFI